MLIAISIPLTETLTSLVLLVAIHLPSPLQLASCSNCHRYTRTESDQTTIRKGTVLQQPSYILCGIHLKAQASCTPWPARSNHGNTAALIKRLYYQIIVQDHYILHEQVNTLNVHNPSV